MNKAEASTQLFTKILFVVLLTLIIVIVTMLQVRRLDVREDPPCNPTIVREHWISGDTREECWDSRGDPGNIDL